MSEFILRFSGDDASRDNRLDFYDASIALNGFQRSLAIVAHLVLNGEVITQAPSLKNAKIYSAPPQNGSWETQAIIEIVGHVAEGVTADLIVRLIFKIYQLVSKRAIGLPIAVKNYLEDLYNENNDFVRIEPIIPRIRQGSIDDAAEKCEIAIKNIHRPLIKSKTASKAHIFLSQDKVDSLNLDEKTYILINEKIKSVQAEEFRGIITSFNDKTYSGRISTDTEERSVPFKLSKECKNSENKKKITYSLYARNNSRLVNAPIIFQAFVTYAKNGRIIELYVVEVKSN